LTEEKVKVRAQAQAQAQAQEQVKTMKKEQVEGRKRRRRSGLQEGKQKRIRMPRGREQLSALRSRDRLLQRAEIPLGRGQK
jgi:hypothetical protein